GRALHVHVEVAGPDRGEARRVVAELAVRERLDLHPEVLAVDLVGDRLDPTAGVRVLGGVAVGERQRDGAAAVSAVHRAAAGRQDRRGGQDRQSRRLLLRHLPSSSRGWGFRGRGWGRPGRYRPSSSGRKVTIEGTNVTSSRTTSSGSRNGSVPRKTSWIGIRATGLITNSTAPIGGVSNPIIRFMITITPKCIGSTPNSAAIGSRIGTVITRAETPSRIAPSRISRTLTSSRKTIA